jgi:hypothetical protein
MFCRIGWVRWRWSSISLNVGEPLRQVKIDAFSGLQARQLLCSVAYLMVDRARNLLREAILTLGVSPAMTANANLYFAFMVKPPVCA